MTFRRYWSASALAVVTGVVIAIFARMLADWPFAEELLLTIGGLLLLFPFLLLIGVGRKISTVLENGARVSHMRVGARVLSVLFFGSVAVLLLFLVFVEPRDAESSIVADLIVRTVFALISLALVYLSTLIYVARVEWDDETIKATTYFIVVKRHSWSDLKSIKKGPLFSDSQSHLIFESTGKARIFNAHEAYDEIIQLAESKLNHA